MSSAKSPKQLLFVCSGNFYRSRLAELLFNHWAAAAGIPWQATSRGLVKAGDLKGMSEHAVAFLRDHDLGHLAKDPRDPMILDVEDLTESDLMVGLCRDEHEPMINQKFLSLARAMKKAGRIRYWQIYDIPAPPRAIVRLLGGGHKGPSQPPGSGTEHISMAVKVLLEELRTVPGSNSRP